MVYTFLSCICTVVSANTPPLPPPPFATLALLQTAGGWGGLYAGCDIFSHDYALLVLALPFHHGDLEPDCVGVSTRIWGTGAERRNARWRDAPNASGELQR